MGQKTHPTGFRVGIIQNWASSWYAKFKEYRYFVKEDDKIRKFIKKKLYTAGVSKIKIDRNPEGIDELRQEVTKYIGKPVIINVVEVARIDADAQLVAENIAQQLEKRIAFRRAMKQAMQRTMRSGVQGIKVMVSGRLGGAEIARSEWAKEGRIPLQTLRADVDYGFAEADTIMGKIGVKVWIFKGNLMPGEMADPNIKHKNSKDNSEKSGRRPRRGRNVETTSQAK